MTTTTNAARRAARATATWARETALSTRRIAGPLLLCIVGGALWLAGIETGHATIGLVLAIVLWANAIDAAATHAHGRGQVEGIEAAHMIVTATDKLRRGEAVGRDIEGKSDD